MKLSKFVKTLDSSSRWTDDELTAMGEDGFIQIIQDKYEIMREQRGDTYKLKRQLDEDLAFGSAIFKKAVSPSQLTVVPSGKTLLMSYRTITGYITGRYGDLIILGGKDYESIDSRDDSKIEADSFRQGSKLAEATYGLIDDMGIPPSISQIYLYVGKYGQEQAQRYAKELAVAGGLLTIVACRCDLQEKKRFADSLDTRLMLSECSGSETLGKLADFLTGKTSEDPRIYF